VDKIFKEAFSFILLKEKSVLNLPKISYALFKIILVIFALEINLPPVIATDSFETHEEVITGQDAVCKLVDGPLGKMFSNEQYNLIFHILSKSIILYGNAPYVLFELGPDGKPSRHWRICINIVRVNNIPSTQPEFPYAETKVAGLQEITPICQKEPVPAMCNELLANNLEKRSFVIIGTSRSSEVDHYGVTSKDFSEIILVKPLILETEVSPSNLTTAEPVAKQEARTAVSAPSTEHSAALPITKTTQTKIETTGDEEHNHDWIMAQPSENYTLQVMVLSSKASVQRFLKKYAAYSDSLKYYTLGINNQEKYELIYGSFPTLAEAQKSKINLPAEFKYSLEKKFKLVQIVKTTTDSNQN